MALPIAHGLVGAGIVAAFLEPSRPLRWRMLVLGAMLGICPDFDYALNWLRISWGGWHHGFTHSITFALFLGVVTALIVKEWRLRSVLTFSAAVFSHALLDYIMTHSRGIALLWPLTNRRYKLELFQPINYSWDSDSWNSVADLLRISLLELLIFGPIVFLMVWFVRRIFHPRENEKSG